MEKSINNSIIQCRNLTLNDKLSDEQYADIARLIYQTDRYIYPAIFGCGDIGVECAVRLLTDVFESKKDEMFSKDNLYVLEEGRRIIALILWHKGRLIWNPEYLIESAHKKGLLLDKQNIELVRKEYVVYCYANSEEYEDNTVSLINVCVAENRQGKGIGSRILGDFIKEYGSQTLELTVLADNYHAVKLYKRYGFSTVRVVEGFAITSQKPMCLRMRREKGKLNNEGR